MRCNELQSVLMVEGLDPLPSEAQKHLAGCSACQDLLADFSAIVATARSLPSEVQPPDRVWISLRAQLEAEGIIRQPEVVSEKSSWWLSFSELVRPRNLATLGVGLLLFAGAVLQTRNKSVEPSQKTAANLAPAANTASNVAPGSSFAPPVGASTVPGTKVALPSPSEAAVTLQQAEQDLPNIQLAGNSTVDASLRQNLRTVDEFIAECEFHLKQNPQDELAREYLYGAYQQKAELLAAMMDSGRSEN
jgi:hypothetical protein